MAVDTDFRYLERLIDRGLVHDPVLELGSHNRQGGPRGNTQSHCEAAGLRWDGADVEAGPGVTLTFDLLDEEEVARIGARWRSVLLFNLLEHVYDPVRALGNALRLVQGPGTCVVVGPAVWGLHDYPRDYWRPLPDFFIEFAARTGSELVPDALCWLLENEQIVPVAELTEGDQKRLPSRLTAPHVYGRFRAARSRWVHKALNTIGRELHFPYTGLGVVLRVPGPGTGRP